MRELNGRQDWYKYKNSRAVRELNEVWPEKSGQVMCEFLGFKNFYKVANKY